MLQISLFCDMSSNWKWFRCDLKHSVLLFFLFFMLCLIFFFILFIILIFIMGFLSPFLSFISIFLNKFSTLSVHFSIAHSFQQELPIFNNYLDGPIIIRECLMLTIFPLKYRLQCNIDYYWKKKICQNWKLYGLY